MDITKVVLRSNPKEDEIGLYLTIFESQLKFLSIPESEWIPYLISSLPTEKALLIPRQDEENSQDYRKVKEMLLKRYRLTANRFRQLFSQHKKSPDRTWRAFYFEIASYFEVLITEFNIKKFQKGPEQQEAFETLKKRIITPKVLKQSNGSKPFRIRTGASSYVLGAVLTRGESTEEHVIEYASRLLIPAEPNYSNTERGALAVVWALEKFRGYVENQEIIIAFDHQPLKWLMSIKSPSGRLARWALQIQSFNLKIEYTPGKTNVLADMLSRPTNLNEDVPCGVFAISADFPVRRLRDIREEQLKDEDLKKIIDCFEKKTEEAQLVVPIQERERVLQEYHDAPTAGHYGAEVTYNKVTCRYYFPGMRKYIVEYVENYPDCNRYKPSNQTPTGLLRTSVYAQRFETLAIDLFGPLPETSFGKKWIFLVEDTSTKCMELFALKEATSVNWAKSLVEEVLLRYGLPRRIISDNCSQFRSQTRLAILVRDEHDTWDEKPPTIRFALNTAKCETTNHTAAYLQFGGELRTTDDVTHDLKTLVDNDNFVAEITPYLKRFARLTAEIKDHVEQKQDKRKACYDRCRIQVFNKPVVTNLSPTMYDIADPAKPDEGLATYNSSAVRAYELPVARDSGIVAPLRECGRPKKFCADFSPRRRVSQRGSL
ncbi:Transposon Tf2-9 polyprotein like [Argiope bruennichi]|uniref:RNA-directed DNA polymerase n=1 Tax=Argiope bruennichi TaxID=94029 RepID=A0A8T0F8Q1_ARGBR|nr:Transposon Tf2-9 polyprotein like [Argiope bruennichi]